jgi:hypothetical protein
MSAHEHPRAKPVALAGIAVCEDLRAPVGESLVVGASVLSKSYPLLAEGSVRRLHTAVRRFYHSCDPARFAQLGSS